MKCKRNDPVCEGGEATKIVVWIPTGEEFPVCVPCSEAITKRAKRVAEKLGLTAIWGVK
jgi:hypothetical protein